MEDIGAPHPLVSDCKIDDLQSVIRKLFAKR